MSNEITANFEVDIEHLHKLGAVDPYSKQSLELYASGKLVSNERLYLTLWGCSELNLSLFDPKTRICTAGQPAEAGYFIVTGTALGIQGSHIYRLGPGSVIGLAEGIAGIDYAMTVVAVSALQVRVMRACAEFCVNGLMAGNCRLVRSHNEHKETRRP